MSQKPLRNKDHVQNYKSNLSYLAKYNIKANRAYFYSRCDLDVTINSTKTCGDAKQKTIHEQPCVEIASISTLLLSVDKRPERGVRACV